MSTRRKFLSVLLAVTFVTIGLVGFAGTQSASAAGCHTYYDAQQARYGRGNGLSCKTPLDRLCYNNPKLCAPQPGQTFRVNFDN